MSRARAITRVADEEALTALASRIAQRWQAGPPSLVVGLRGELGAGKTTFVRALLRGLGYTGRVPSPTYTLLEEYVVSARTIVHLDLYRLGGDRELETLGIRDWLGRAGVWVLVEWPERAPRLLGAVDLVLELRIPGGTVREVEGYAATAVGEALLESISDLLSN